MEKYAEFLVDDFSPTEYANRLAESAEISTALARLNFSLDSVNRAIHEHVTQKFYAELQRELSFLQKMDASIAEITGGTCAVDAAFARFF